MTRLKVKDANALSDGMESFHYRPRPGDLLLFNSYLPHSFLVDPGLSTFRFIHFNLQALPKEFKSNG